LLNGRSQRDRLTFAKDIPDKIGEDTQVGVLVKTHLDAISFLRGRFAGQVSTDQSTINIAPCLLLLIAIRSQFSGENIPLRSSRFVFHDCNKALPRN